LDDSHPVRSRLRHVEITDELLNAALERIGGISFPASATLEQLKSGTSSSSFRLQLHDGARVLRFDYFRDRGDLESDNQVVAALLKAGVAVHSPYELIAEVNSVAFSVRPHEEGVLVADLTKPGEDVLFASGQQLGLIHKTTSPTSRFWFYSQPLQHPMSIKGPADDQLRTRALRILQSASDATRTQMDSKEALVHSDFKSDNLLWRNNQIVVLDIEKAANGSSTFDLALALFHTITGPHPDHTSLRLAQCMFEGYRRSGAPIIEPSVAEMMPAMLYSAAIFYLIDLEIATTRQSDAEVSHRHRNYFENYCTPRFSRLLEISAGW
jgi:Ser/Thr protein kinase RdoA (MazF antagonist)